MKLLMYLERTYLVLRNNDLIIAQILIRKQLILLQDEVTSAIAIEAFKVTEKETLSNPSLKTIITYSYLPRINTEIL